VSWRDQQPDLPAGWEWAEFGSLANTQLGKMLSKVSKTGVNERPYLRNQNVQWGRFVLDDLATMAFTDLEAQKFALEPGDLIVCEGGEVGRAAVWNGPAEVFYQKALHRVRPATGVDVRFLMHALQRMTVGDLLEGFTSGSTIAHLPQEDLRRLPVPLPPEAEQKRIVAELERRFAHLDAAERSLSSVLRRIEAARKAVILAAVPNELPSDWAVVLTEAAGEARLGLQRSPARHTGPQMRPYLRVANVFEDRVDLTDVMQMNFTDEEQSRYRLHVGDILLNEGQTPELLGRPAMWSDPDSEMYFTNSLIRFRCREDVLPEWALLVFRHHMHAGRFRGESRITTNIAHLALGRFKKVEFPVPPVEQQRQVVDVTAARLSHIEDVNRDTKRALDRVATLRRSLLAAAFSGRLVPGDPDDEPASELLARIAKTRAETEAAEKEAKAAARRAKKASKETPS
jgi:type I restriction enzyme S subunit